MIPDRPADDQTMRQAIADLANDLAFTLIEGPRFAFISQGDPLDLAWDEARHGVLIGSLFRRHDHCAVTQLSSAESRAIATTGGQFLIDKYWGNYVAILADQAGEVSIVRAPFGDLPCYYTRYDGGTLIASDIDLIERGGAGRAKIDWNGIGLQLIAPDIRRDTTCLTGIFELQGGDRLAVDRQLSTQTLWTPWTFVAPQRRQENVADAADLLAETICRTVEALTRDYAATILLLSGGLDSSIVAAALARAGRNCTALTMVTRAVGGDERAYARRAADHVGFDLREILRDPSTVAIARSAAADRPYPIERSFTQATAAAAAEVAINIGAQAVLHGGGGDNIFCALQSAAPLADLIRTHGFDARWSGLTRDIAVNAQATSPEVLKQAAARLLWRSPRYRWEARTGLLTSPGRSFAAAAVRHPWLDAPSGALSGSAGHIGLILAALSVVQSPDIATPLPWRAVLLNQPVIETCLSIPSWLWYERGRNRAVARRAFSPLLPEAVAWRPTKGAMDSFIVEIFEANRVRLKPMLLDGALARSGLIDRQAVNRILDDTGPVRGRDFGRLMHFADIEAWLASWT